ncbi:Pre-mRNA-splicing regulator female-lethal(2)D [Fasciola gigantica]|uniref:Pre-mRNA-splicing regulator female-lethal(2)D n=1 Tax=Fasciola gigantica TaxID=46835 RepID=A0A504YLS6_FASGI|nr:Pre-mRNA-splicing regulator female-lethal(2)D [Fasciola gigantica]
MNIPSNPSVSITENPGEVWSHNGSGSSDLSQSTMLKAKLAELQKEKEELEEQLSRQRENHEKQMEDYITRYVNADFWLAQLNTILPARKMRSPKSGPTPQLPVSLGCGDSLFFSRKMFEPATNLVYKKMHGFAKEAQTRVRQSNDDLLAWKFNPESASGKQMMGRIRQLLSENEKLGQVNHADRVASLESDAELQSTCIKEFIKTHSGIENVLEETYTDIEGLQNSLLIVHQQIDRAEAVVTNLQEQLELKQPGRAAELMAAVLVQLSEQHQQAEYDLSKTNEVPTEAELDEKLSPPVSEKNILPPDTLTDS